MNHTRPDWPEADRNDADALAALTNPVTVAELATAAARVAAATAAFGRIAAGDPDGARRLLADMPAADAAAFRLAALTAYELAAEVTL